MANIDGTFDDDNIVGTSGDDAIAGGAGDDTVAAGAGNDVVRPDDAVDGNPAAFISEVRYAGADGEASGEFIEVAWKSTGVLDDYTLSFYEADGTSGEGDLATTAISSTLPGLVGEATLADIFDAAGGGFPTPQPTDGSPLTIANATVGGVDLTISIDPENPDFWIFTIPTSGQSGEGATFEGVALTDTDTGTVIQAYDFGDANMSVFNGGAADGAVPDVIGDNAIDFQFNVLTEADSPGDASLAAVEDGTGNDSVFGESGDDTIFGQAGDDILYGDTTAESSVDSDSGDGADEITGDSGDDIILGNEGNDVIYGDGETDPNPDAFFSELNYQGAGEDDGELIEISIRMTENLADYTLGTYDGQATADDSLVLEDYQISSTLAGIIGEVTLQEIVDAAGGTLPTLGNPVTIANTSGGNAVDLTIAVDPENPDFYVFTIPTASNTTAGSTPNSADAFVLTNTAEGEVVQAIDVGQNNSYTSISGGAADGLTPTYTVIAANANISINGVASTYGTDDVGTTPGDGTMEPIIVSSGDDTLSGHSGDDEIFGQNGQDSIFGGDGDDTVDGGDGNDTLYGNEGADDLNGGAGADTVYGNSGDDFAAGDSGDDLIYGQNNDDTLRGNDGNDTIYGDGEDLVGEKVFISEIHYSGSGDEAGEFVEVALHFDEDPADYVLGFYEATGGTSATLATEAINTDALPGYTGEISLQDIINEVGGLPTPGNPVSITSGVSGSIDLTISVDPDNEEVYVFSIPTTLNSTTGGSQGSQQNAEIVTLTNINDGTVIQAIDYGGDSGVSTVTGGAADGASVTYLGITDDVKIDSELVATDTDETFDPGNVEIVTEETSGDDLITAHSGDDFVDGQIGDDLLSGSAGNDEVYGASGEDTLHGASGDDSLFGGSGDDTIFGEDGNDSIEGGTGGDQIEGQSGDDLIYGNSGDDTIYGDQENYAGEPAFISEVHYTGADGEASGEFTEVAIRFDQDLSEFVVGFYEADGSDTATLSTFEVSSTLPGVVGEVSLQDIVDAAGGTLPTVGNPVTITNTSGGNAVDLTISVDPENEDFYIFTIPTQQNSFTNGTNQNGLIQTEVVTLTNISTGEVIQAIDFGGNSQVDFVSGGVADGAAVTYVGFSGDIAIDSELNITSVSGGNHTPGDADIVMEDGSGDDTIYAGQGNDYVEGDQQQDLIYGESGDDTLLGQSGDDTVYGDDGNDLVYGGLGEDSLYGNEGEDSLFGSFGDDTIYGGSGDDNLSGNDDADSLFGEDGADSILGGAGADTAFGGAGVDTILGGSGDDSLDWGSGDEVLNLGDEGEDSIFGGFGNDTLTVTTFDGENNFLDGNEDGTDDETADGDIDVLDLSALTPYGADYTITFDAVGGDVQAADPLTAGNTWQDSEDGVVTFSDGSTLVFKNIESVICFAKGTMIATKSGQVAIEDLQAGDRVMTMDNGYQKIRWIGSSTVPATGKLAPIRIRKGTFNNDRDLLLSPQHRVLLSGWEAEMLYGEPEVLVAAKMLVDDHKVTRVPSETVEYFHILFDRHEIIFSEGCPTESFHPGQEGWGALADAAREEILEIFPELVTGPEVNNYGPAARRSLKQFEAEAAMASGIFMKDQ